MRKKWMVWLLMISVVLLSFAGCQNQAVEESLDEITEEIVPDPIEQVMTWDMGAEPKTLDPQMNSALDASHLINNTFSGLMRDYGDEIRPELIERYEVSQDQLTYTFYLKDTKWSDGVPLTAHDFEYAWKRALSPEQASEYAFQLFYIKGGQAYYEGTGTADEVAVNAINDHILEVTLIAPTPYFIELTAFMTYMPVRREVVEKPGASRWAKNPDVFVSNGPFVLYSYTDGEGMRLEKNPHYLYADSVKLEAIDVGFSSDGMASLKAFEAGELDVLDIPPVEKIAELEAENPNFYIFPHNGILYYLLNVNDPLMQDVRIRKALSLAVDRNAIVTNVTKGGQTPATGVVPYGVYDHTGAEFREQAGDYDLPTQFADVETARALLAEAGYPNGEGMPAIEIVVDDTSEYLAIAQFVTEMWREVLNVESVIVTKTWAELQDIRHRGEYTIARGGWIGDYSDPMTFLDVFLSYSGNNDSHWSNAEFDNLIEEAKLMKGVDRTQRLYDAERLIAENHIIIPIYYYTDPAMISDKMVGWKRTGMGSWYFGEVEMVE